MNEKERDFFDKNAHHWDEMSVHDLDVVRFLADSLGLEGHESVLDVGTGTGIMLPFYRERTDGPITAVDFSPNMLRVAESKYPAEEFGIEYVVSDVYEYSPGRMFDVIVCYSCFPHFEDKPGAIARLVSMLPEGGKLMISHGCSRDHINRVHESGGEAIQEDHLPDMPHLRAMVEGSGMEPIAEFDDDRMFGIVAVKHRSRSPDALSCAVRKAPRHLCGRACGPCGRSRLRPPPGTGRRRRRRAPRSRRRWPRSWR